MILLWGSLEDEPMAMAHEALARTGAAFTFLDHRRIFSCDIESDVDGEGDTLSAVSDGARRIDLADVTVAYIRGASYYDYEELEGRPPEDPLAVRAAGFESQLTACLESCGAVVINPSRASASNNSKPYQLTVIREAGLLIPETLISNDQQAVRRFLSENPEAIFKSVSGVRSIVKPVTDEERALVADVAWCPALFQRVVPGTNYRAHVVNGEVLAVRLESDRLDYRYGRTTMVAAELPAEVAGKCRRLNSMLGLHFTGIDLMRTPDDEWYCFEVNTSPGYSYFERGSGQPISAALARFMADVDAGTQAAVALTEDGGVLAAR